MAEIKNFFNNLFGRNEEVNGNTDGSGNGNPIERKPKEILEVTPAVVDNAKLTLKEILTTMQFSVEVEPKELKDNTIKMEITGKEDLGLVIGKEGSTLNSLQFLLTNILSKKYGKKVYVHLDANDYKAKQEQQIIASAQDAADVAERENVQIILDPMTAAERRLVHTYLQTRPSVVTFSRGEGPSRQVVISPKDFKKESVKN